MQTNNLLWAVLLAGILSGPLATMAQTPLGSTWSYQGRLVEDGTPVNDLVDLRFTLCETEAADCTLGLSAVHDGQAGNGAPVDVIDGLFTVQLDFGSGVFNDEARWLEIEVRSPHDPTDTLPFTVLSPRQPLTAAPFALYALDSPGGGGAVWQQDGADAYYDTGNVGIGTNNPSGPLQLGEPEDDAAFKHGAAPHHLISNRDLVFNAFDQDENVDGDRLFLFRRDTNKFDESAFTELVMIDDSGRVGIGTTSPGAVISNSKLDVIGGHVAISNNFGILSYNSAGTTFGAGMDTTPDDDVHWYAGGAARASATAAGDVGIGTTAPGERLDVRGDVDIIDARPILSLIRNSNGEGITLEYHEIEDQLRIQNRANNGDTFESNVAVFEASGNVGIGENFLAPATKLHVRGSGSAFGNHVAVFENTDSTNADGVAIKINNSSTNRNNNFVTFLNGQGNVTGRIEGFDLENNDWVNPPPLPNLNLDIDLGITLNPASNWFSAGTPPTAQLVGGEVPSLTFDWCSVLGVNVLCGFDFDPGEFPLVSVNSTPPSITGSPFTFSTPSISFTLPTAQEIQELLCWAFEYGLPGLVGLDPLAQQTQALRLAAAEICRDEGVVYGSKGADYAEYLEKANPDERLRFGEVVGVFGGRVSRATVGAQQVMVVSRAPAVVGNVPAEEDLDRYVKVAFMGQVSIVVRGAVSEGDYLIPSGLGDGAAVAVAPNRLGIEHLSQVIGRAWSGTGDAGLNFVTCVVGVRDEAAVYIDAQQQQRIGEQAAEIAELKRQLGTIMAALEENADHAATH